MYTKWETIIYKCKYIDVRFFKKDAMTQHYETKNLQRWHRLSHYLVISFRLPPYVYLYLKKKASTVFGFHMAPWPLKWPFVLVAPPCFSPCSLFPLPRYLIVPF